MNKYAAFLIVLFGLLVTCHARADHYRTGDLAKLMAVPNWELVRQEVGAATGDDYGAPILVRRYATLAGCNAAQAGRLSKPHKVGGMLVVSKFVCRHKTSDVV